MKRGYDRKGRDSRYLLHFTGAAVLLLSATLVLVLFVLPQRFVLSSGFQEGTLNFPDPTTPFEPFEARLVAALPPPPRTGPVGRGPAELFWDEVLPLLEAERWVDAVPLFALHLGRYPADEGVRREYAITLSRAGEGQLAVPLFQQLLRRREDAGLRLMLARTLRDLGRTSEAVVHYDLLSRTPGFDETMALEWVRALAWSEAYGEAQSVASEMLARFPESLALRVERARLFFYTDQLVEAEAVLAELSEEELSREDAIGLRDDVVAALTPPPVEVEVVPEPTTLERALRAREEGRREEADRLYRLAVGEDAESAVAWEAFADWLQYERRDFDGALVALAEVERLEGREESSLQARMARLEVWLGRNAEARVRLERLLELLEEEEGGAVPADEPGEHSMSRADALAMLGDLDRWDGRRLDAVAHYDAALTLDPTQPEALEGRRVLVAEVEAFVAESEQPGLSALARSFSDTERFDRVDLGGSWRSTDGAWVWATRSGGRLVRGFDATRSLATARGAFADVEGARWLRWGTIRLGIGVGVQSVRSSDVDLTVGASARFVNLAGRSTTIALERGPAFLETNTLQAEYADVLGEQVSIEHSRTLGEVWSVAAVASGMRLDHRDLPGAEANVRVSGALTVQRPVSTSLSLGVGGRAVGFATAAPDPAALPLYWDPAASVSVGPIVQYSIRAGDRWRFTARANPGVAYLDERRSAESEVIPDLAANVGVVLDGARFRTSVDVHYGQGRLGGYRSLGIDISVSAVGPLSGGGG